jgi:hypothetical protein
MLRIKENISIELCARDYASYNELVNEIYGLFKITTCMNNKSYIWIDFLNPN